jgi:hypothetical protein
MSPDVGTDSGVFNFTDTDHQKQHIKQNFQLKELRESVKQSSEDIQKQLQNIDTKTQSYTTITLIISVITLFSLGQLFGILRTIGIFWIPGSFLLWFLWIIFGLFTIKKIIDTKNKTLNTQVSKITNDEIVKTKMMEWFYKTVYPPIIGIFFLFLITLIFIFAIIFSLIETQNQISMEIPIISALFFLAFPFFMRYTKSKTKMEKSETVSILLLIFAIIFAVVLVFIFPYLALASTLKLIPDLPLINFIFGFLIIESIQIFLILLFTSSVSGFIAEMELKNAITNLTRINDEISNLLLYPDEIHENSIYKLIQKYQSTKKYDVHVNWLLIFKTYSIIPNQIFLRKGQD